MTSNTMGIGRESDRKTGRLRGLPCTYLVSGDFERIPIYPWQDIAQEGGIVFHVHSLEFRVTEMEREGCGGGFAGFDGAGEKVDGEDLHFLG